MTQSIDFKEYALLPSGHLNSSFIGINSNTVLSLAASRSCGLVMLADKLLLESSKNMAIKQLIHSLINRIHHNSIAISSTLNDNPKSFILQMIETASILSHSKNNSNTSVDFSAKLLMKAVENFEKAQLDFSTLEYNWKEFSYHFYRSRLQTF